jgi:hypothetical protein
MSFTSIITLFAFVLGCSGADDPKPSKDAPDLDFSKPSWINEFQYDGVFTVRRDINNIYWGDYHFNDGTNKVFVPNNSAYKLENGIWFNPESKPYFDVNSLPPNRLLGSAKLNGIWLSNYNMLNPIGDLTDKFLNYNIEKGFTWEVLNIEIPTDQKNMALSKLSPNDAKSFIMVKEGLVGMPTQIKIEKEYRLEDKVQNKVIDFEPAKGADMVYIKFSDEGFAYADELGAQKANGFLKYFSPEQKSITIYRNEFDLLLNGRKQVTMTIQAIKFYTYKNDAGRKFIFKNIAESKAKIIIE